VSTQGFSKYPIGSSQQWSSGLPATRLADWQSHACVE
jgi:hypothetical protein